MEKEWQKGRKNICLRLQAYVIHQIEFSYTLLYISNRLMAYLSKKILYFCFCKDTNTVSTFKVFALCNISLSTTLWQK